MADRSEWLSLNGWPGITGKRGQIHTRDHFSYGPYDMASFRTPTRFSFFEQKKYFCSHIAECANIAEFTNIAEIKTQQ
jgi:hypothetical protein